MKRSVLLAAFAFAASAAPAFAHLDPAAHGSFLSGVSHPLTGLDHVLVMVAVGLWAAQIGGRALWAIPASFVMAMALGFGLSNAGVTLPFVEPAILASIVALGLLVAMAVRVNPVAGMAVVGTFALFHGYAHGSELGSAGAMSFGLGFAVSTALLHAAGLGLGIALARLPATAAITRLAGGATAITGLVLMVS